MCIDYPMIGQRIQLLRRQRCMTQDQLAEKLEMGDTSLEVSFILYRQGMELLKLCSGKLDTVEKKMLQLNEDGTFSEFSR